MFKSACTLLSALAFCASAAMADGAVYDKKIEKILEKVGSGMVYKNGRKSLAKERACTLVYTDFETESFDRTMLTIALTGKPLANVFGINPHSAYIDGETFSDGPVFYDPTSKEKVLKDGEAFGFEYCSAESNSAFAGDCDKAANLKTWTSRVMVYPEQRVEMTWTYKDKNGKTDVTKVVCRY